MIILFLLDRFIRGSMREERAKGSGGENSSNVTSVAIRILEGSWRLMGYIINVFAVDKLILETVYK